MSTRRLLVPHPQTPDGIVQAIAVDVAIRGRALHLDYGLQGPLGRLCIPDYEEPVRTDGLWQDTCCEAFLRAKDQPGYYEINLSPSTQWAVYRFSGYRAGMRPVDIGAAPVIDCAEDDGIFHLRACVDLAMLPRDTFGADMDLGLSCVVRGTDGMTAYWALNHPREKPDFHHDDCFAHQIKAAERL